MSAELERSYRRALRWYPSEWRDRNADVMVGTLLDVADADQRSRPRAGELAGFAASGLSARLGVFLEPQARNAISTIALATGVGYPLAHLAFLLWSPSGPTHNPDWALYAHFGFDAIVNPGLIIAATWLLALVLAFALTPRQHGIKPAIVLTILASVALIAANRIPGIGAEWYGLTTTSMVFLILLGVLVFMGTPVRGLRLVLCTVAASGLIFGSYAVTGLVTSGASIDERTFWRSFSQPLALVLCVAVLAAVALAIAGRRTAAQTLVISAIPWAIIIVRELGSQDVWNTLALFVIATLLVGFGALLPLAFRRATPASIEESNKI